MVKLILQGCNGRMGRIITDIVKEDDEVEIVAGVDLVTTSSTYPVFAGIDECDIEADVVVDFGAAVAVDSVIDYCVSKNIALVECTTGLSEETMSHLKAASEKIAVLKSANMSLGINLMMKLLKEAVNVLAPAGFDVEIVEKHHRNKLDAPSGTAIALADSINVARDNEYEYIYDRSQVSRKRGDKELGISAVRGGSIVGDHDVIFAGQDEVITFSHTAYSRAVFGKGAIQAGKFLANRPAGFYDMSDVIG